MYLHSDSFTQEANLLTPTMKLKRTELNRYFRKEIDDIIAGLLGNTSRRNNWATEFYFGCKQTKSKYNNDKLTYKVGSKVGGGTGQPAEEDTRDGKHRTDGAVLTDDLE